MRAGAAVLAHKRGLDGSRGEPGRRWTIARMGQAIDQSQHLKCWTTWTAFSPSILHAALYGNGSSLVHGMFWSAPYATTDSPFLLKIEQSKCPSRPNFNSR